MAPRPTGRGVSPCPGQYQLQDSHLPMRQSNEKASGMGSTAFSSEFPEDYDRARLKKAGEQVRARLAANPSVYKVPNDRIELFAVGDFMTASECERMIALTDEKAKPSTVYDHTENKGFRTSYSGDVDPQDRFVRKIDRRIDDLLGIDPVLGESIQGQRYRPGQEFKPHHDYFHPQTAYFDLEMKRGGQRCYTAMVFLNEVEAGGTTDFVDLDLSIVPKPGVLLAWNNALPDGQLNWNTIHAGTPVQAGVKYIITKWYRTRPWG